MKKLMGNIIVCVGSFSGPDIEEGTFHDEETAADISHKSKTPQKCPCPPDESQEAKASEGSGDDNEKGADNKG